MSKIISQLSGGYDSTAVAIKLLNEGHEVKCLFFNYGQKYLKQERKALVYIDSVLQDKEGYLGYKEIVINMRLNRNRDGSPSDYIPIRNMVLGAMSANYAVAEGYNFIAVGNKTTKVRPDDAYSFADCSYDFYNLMTQTTTLAAENGDKIKFIMPLVINSEEALTKGDVVNIIKDEGLDFNQLWSCYEDGELPCGTCYHCRENKEAFRLAGVEDPILYK